MAWAYIGESYSNTVNINQNHFGASTTLTPGIPAGLSDGDFMICVAALRENAAAVDITMSAGWTALFATQKHTSGENSIRAFYRRFVTGDTDPTVTFAGGGTGDTTLAGIFAFSGGLASGDPLDVLGTFSENASAVNIGPISGITPIVNDALVLVIGEKADATASHVGDSDVLTGDSLTWGEAWDRGSLAGSDSTMTVGYAIISGAPVAVSDKTFTNAAVASTGCGIMLSLKPEPTGGSPQTVEANAISQAPTLFNPKTFLEVESPLLSNAPSLFNPTTVPGAVTVVVPLLAHGHVVYSSAVVPPVSTVIAQLIAEEHTLFDPKLLHQVAIPLLDNPTSLFDPQITQKIVVDLVNQSGQLYDPSVAQLITAELLSQTPQLFDPMASPGGVTVVAQLLSNGNILFDFTVATGISLVQLELLSNGNSFFDPIVSPGGVSVVAQLITQTPVLLDPQVLQTIVAQLIGSLNTLYDPSISAVARVVTQLISQDGVPFDPEISTTSFIGVDDLAQSPALLSPMVLAGSVVVQAGSLQSLTSLYDPTVTEEQFVLVAIIENPASLGSPRVFLGVVPSNFQWDSTYGLASTKDAGPPTGTSDLKITDQAEQTGRDDLKRTR